MLPHRLLLGFNVCTHVDHAALQIHEPQCGTVTVIGSFDIVDEEFSLNIDAGHSEIAFLKLQTFDF